LHVTISVSLDRDLEVKVQKFAEGIGVEVSELIERAIVYALSSRYPDQGLPGDQPEIDNELPRPPFDGTVDNELPDGEPDTDPDFGIEEERPARPDQGLPGSGARPDQGLPGEGGKPVDPGFGTSGKGMNPDLDPNANPDLGRKGGAQPKK
jgi:hypothetical protein